MLPAREQACNPAPEHMDGPQGVRSDIPLATSLSTKGPGTKHWTRPVGPAQRPANYLSRGAPKVRPKLSRDGDTPFFHRTFDEWGELVGVAGPPIMDSALVLPHHYKPVPVKRGMVRGFFNALISDSEVANFEAANAIDPSEIDELVALLDDDVGKERTRPGVLTQAQLLAGFRKYRHFDPSQLQKERRLMFRLRTHLLVPNGWTVQQWFDTIGAKLAVKLGSIGAGSTKPSNDLTEGSVGGGSIVSGDGGGGASLKASARAMLSFGLATSSESQAGVEGASPEKPATTTAAADIPVEASVGEMVKVIKSELLPSNSLLEVSSTSEVCFGDDGVATGESLNAQESGVEALSKSSDEKEGSVDVDDDKREIGDDEDEEDGETVECDTVVDTDHDESSTVVGDENGETNGSDSRRGSASIEEASGNSQVLVLAGNSEAKPEDQPGATATSSNVEGVASVALMEESGTKEGVKKQKSAPKEMPKWGSGFSKGEEHNERVGMTEFRKSLASHLGPIHAYTAREEKLFFKYMGDVQFNAYAPAEVPCAQVEAALRHADRVHLQARMSRILRKIDCRLRFFGWGLEHLFPARMPEGSAGFTATGRARVSPENFYKLRQVANGLKLFCNGELKKKLLQPRRAPIWATFYCTLEPCTPPLPPKPPPPPAPKPTSAGLAAKKMARSLRAKSRERSRERSLSRERSADGNASAKNEIGLDGVMPPANESETLGSTVSSGDSTAIVADPSDNSSAIAIKTSLAFASTSKNSAMIAAAATAAAAAGSVNSNGGGSENDPHRLAANSIADINVDSGLGDMLADLEALSDDDEEDEDDDGEEDMVGESSLMESSDGIAGNSLFSTGGDTGGGSHATLRAKTRASEQLDDGNGGFVLKWHPGGSAHEAREDAIQGVVRTAVLTKYGVVVETVEERNGWPWERIVVDMDHFTQTAIKVPLDPSLLDSTRKAWNITDEEIAAAAKRNRQAPERKSSLLKHPLLDAKTFDPTASSSAGQASISGSNNTSNGGVGSGNQAAALSAEVRQSGSPQEPESMDNPSVNTNLEQSGLASDVLSSSTSVSAGAAMETLASSDSADAPGGDPHASVRGGGAAAVVALKPPARTWSIAVVPAAHYDRKGVTPPKGGIQHDPMSWSTRTAAGGGRCGGYCFKLEHPSKRLDVWCRSANEVNQWVGAFTGDAKVPMALHSERLPQPELQDNDNNNDGEDDSEAVARAKERKKKEEDALPKQAAWVTPEALAAAAKANADFEEEGGEAGGTPVLSSAEIHVTATPDATTEEATIAPTSGATNSLTGSSKTPKMGMSELPESAPVAATHASIESQSSTSLSVDPNTPEGGEEDEQNGEAKPKRGPRGKFQSMFGPSAAATIVRRARGSTSDNSNNNNGSHGAMKGANFLADKSQTPLAPFATNSSRQKVCCFCGERETPAVPPPPFRPPPPPPPPLGWGPFNDSPDKQLPPKTLATGKEEGSKGSGKGAGKGSGKGSNKHRISPKKGAEVVDERAQAKVNFIAPAKSPRGTGQVADGEGALLHGPYFAGRRPNEQGGGRGGGGRGGGGIGATRALEAKSATSTVGNNTSGNLVNSSKGSGGRGSRAQAAAAAVKTTNSKAASEAADPTKTTTAAATAAEPLPPMKWGLKPREVFIACPFGLISDLACWPCLALNARSAHSEQQANVTVPFRAHGALFHTSDAVSGWTVAPPAAVACATAAAAAVAEATTQWGYRTALKVERPPGQPYDITPGPVAKLNKSRPDVYNPAWAAAAAKDPSKKPFKQKAQAEVSEDEEGWVLESTDEEVMDSRWELEKRLKWINTTADRLAPLVKAQFRRALVQDAELKRRRAKLVSRANEQVMIMGGIGTGVITGEAYIPAVPNLKELEKARAQTEKDFKMAMSQRAYSRVTALEEQMGALVERHSVIGAEEDALRASDAAQDLLKNRPKTPPPWDQGRGTTFRQALPLLRALPDDARLASKDAAAPLSTPPTPSLTATTKSLNATSVFVDPLTTTQQRRQTFDLLAATIAVEAAADEKPSGGSATSHRNSRALAASGASVIANATGGAPAVASTMGRTFGAEGSADAPNHAMQSAMWG